jgi:ABC-type multidrug transport system fused ATPase/permease subunit
MKKRGPLIFSICFFIAIWFLVPFSLAFLEDVPFSFGPAGYQLYSVSEYFLYSGIINRNDSTLGQILVIVWMLALPLTLFAYHIYLLCKNQDYIKRLIKLDEINPRQYFIIKSGKLSFIIFFVQIFNVSKLVFSLVLQDHEDQNPIAQIVLFSLNIVFDLLPIILIVIYFKYYYRQGRALQEKSDLLDRSLASSFTSATII